MSSEEGEGASSSVKYVPRYDIGALGVKWGPAEIEQWRARQKIKRSYEDEVVQKIFNTLDPCFVVEQFGALSCDPEKYKLYVVTSKPYDSSKPTILVTGGCHGYETSGVQGAIRFLETKAVRYTAHFNVVAVPCLSPWAYETINRWTPEAVDPNRTFANDPTDTDSSSSSSSSSSGGGSESSTAEANDINIVSETSEQAIAFQQYLRQRRTEDSSFRILAHFDLHETTDEDNTEFGPARTARDGMVNEVEHEIPDGFYLVGNDAIPTPDFHTAVLDAAAQVTHIAAADPHGCITGQPIAQRGLISIPARKYGLCFAVAKETQYGVTTEVHPAPPVVTNEHCNDAHVAAICGGLDFIVSKYQQHNA